MKMAFKGSTYFNRFILGRSKSLSLYLTFAILLASFGPWPFDFNLSNLDWNSRQITVLTKSSPLTYKKINNHISGIEYDLIQNFSTVTGFKIKWKVYPTEAKLIAAFESGEGDLIAGRVSPQWIKTIGAHRGPSFEDSSLYMVCLRRLKVNSPDDLLNKMILVQKGKTSQMNPVVLQANRSIFWNEVDISSQEILRNLAYRKGDCAVAEYFEAIASLRKFPNLELKFRVSEEATLGWMFRSNDFDLQRALTTWTQLATRNGFIISTLFRYKAHLHELSYSDYLAFWSQVRSTLPKYEAAFKKSGKKYQIPWQLLAAVAYQESKWNPEAKSFTGVTGLMQITQETAAFLGLEDRTDIESSIDAGAKYLRMLLDRTPKHLPHKERMNFALAAWNIGPGHLEDAQGLAEGRKMDPNSWYQIKKILPLLSDESTYKDLRYGRARGEEPIQFVNRVHNYYDILSFKLN